MTEYEFHVYDCTPEGEVGEATVTKMVCMNAQAAISVARKLCKQSRGPVDVLRAGLGSISERSLGTATLKWRDGPSTATEWESFR